MEKDITKVLMGDDSLLFERNPQFALRSSTNIFSVLRLLFSLIIMFTSVLSCFTSSCPLVELTTLLAVSVATPKIYWVVTIDVAMLLSGTHVLG